MNFNYIPGIVMRPCSINEQDNEKMMQSTEVSVKNDFYGAYSHHMAAMQIVAECAKVYINNNWKKVKDWRDLEVVMEARGRDNPLEDYVEYYNYREENKRKAPKNEVLRKAFERMDKHDQERHNPATEVSEVILDPTDGDFSITINGTDHIWISDSTVIIIADYIEKQLKLQKDESIEL